MQQRKYLEKIAGKWNFFSRWANRCPKYCGSQYGWGDCVQWCKEEKFGHGFLSSLVSNSLKGIMDPATTSFGNEYSRDHYRGYGRWKRFSELTGGKFANGAVTSALQWWF